MNNRPYIDSDDVAPHLRESMHKLLNQALLVLVAQNGGTWRVPVSVIDTAPVGKVMTMDLADGPNGKEFVFTVGAKS